MEACQIELRLTETGVAVAGDPRKAAPSIDSYDVTFAPSISNFCAIRLPLHRSP